MSSPQAAGTAGGSPQHTHFQLDPDQIEMLREALDPRRVGDDGKGHAALEQWDIRRTLIRIFGFGGYNTELLSTDLVREIEQSSKWTVVYRVTSRLTVKDRRGNVVGVYEDGAVGDAKNQPKLGDAHDQAFKSAISGALKRCAVNMGDQFGLSLYDNGSVQPVVATPAERYRADALRAWDDRQQLLRVYGQAQAANVLGEVVESQEGDRVQLGEWIVARGKELAGATEQPAAAPAPAPAEAPAAEAPAAPAAEKTPDDIRDQTKRSWANAVALQQVLVMAQTQGLAGEVMPGDPTNRTIGQVLRERLSALQQGQSSPTVTAEQAGGVPAQRERGAA